MRRAVIATLAVSASLMALAPALSQAQQQQPRPQPGPAAQPQRPAPPPGPAAQQQPPAPQSAPAKPYQPVTITPPAALADPSFQTFRNQLGDIAKRKDRAALAKVVVPKDFFWLGEKGDQADKKRPGIDNLTRALQLNAKDGSGWEALVGYAAEPTAMPMPDRKDTVCAPAEPVFDIKQLEDLAKQTGTDEAEWGYPIQRDLEVRAAAQLNSPVIEKLGLYFVRVMEDDGPEPPPGQMPMLRIVTPSGKIGFVPADALSPLGGDQMCYVKDASGWRIAGFIGGSE